MIQVEESRVWPQEFKEQRKQADVILGMPTKER